MKVLVCIVEAWMCSTTLSTSGLGPVTNPILSLKHNTQISKLVTVEPGGENLI